MVRQAHAPLETPLAPWTASLQHLSRTAIETTGSLVRGWLPNSIHAVTAQGVQLKVGRFIVAVSPGALSAHNLGYASHACIDPGRASVLVADGEAPVWILGDTGASAAVALVGRHRASIARAWISPHRPRMISTPAARASSPRMTPGRASPNCPRPIKMR